MVFGTHGSLFRKTYIVVTLGGDMTTTRFFVYGSLCEGMVHFTKIQNFIESSIVGRIQASAYRLKVGFPALLKEGRDLVPGQLVELKGSELLVGLLDEFFGFNRHDPEKSLYCRDEVDVYPEGATEPVKAWAYFLSPTKLPMNAVKIPGGDWMQSLLEKPSLIAQLSDRQMTYIKKLGKSIGREIVPIDLGLYRELMNLELIVDKGRRLALSKLGQEVFRHLG